MPWKNQIKELAFSDHNGTKFLKIGQKMLEKWPVEKNILMIFDLT